MTDREGRRTRLPVGRIVAVVVAWDAIWWGVLGLLFAPVLPGGWTAVALAALLLVLPILVLVRGFGGAAYPSAATRLLVFRPFWYGQLFLPLLAISGLIGVLLGLPFGAPATAGRGAVGLAGLLLLVLAIVGWFGTRRLTVRVLDLAFADLPEGLAGTRLVQLSDLHVGPHTSRRYLARVVAAVRDSEPDLIAFTGDQVDDYARDMEPFGVAFGDLNAPLGMFAVPGNHDIFGGWDEVRRRTEALGIRVLVNQAVRLERNGSSFWLAGTGDPAGRGWPRGGGAGAADDVGRTLQGVPPGAFTVALAHNPGVWPELARAGVQLTLSGHTHYGQLAMPELGWSLASVFLEHGMGLVRRDAAVLYINPGTNFWGIPLRIGAWPEITVVRLSRGARPSL